jgi:ribosome-binding factor A
VVLESRRLSRLDSQMREEISDIIMRKIKDPRLGLVSVTRTRVSADLSYARVYFNVIGSEADAEKTLACLVHAANFIRSELGRRLHVRRIPELRFFYDDSAERGARIEQILKHLKEGENEQSL